MVESNAASETLTIYIVHSPGPRLVTEQTLCVGMGCTVAQALQLSDVLTDNPGFDPAKEGVGVWGKKALPGQILRDRDRIELYRPLVVDPKVARRERFKKQGAKKTGLFSKLRDGAKAGY